MNKSQTIVLSSSIFLLGILLGILLTFTSQPEEQAQEIEAERQITTHIVAVDDQGKGVLADLITEIRPGEGLVLVNINNVLADFNTQFSARTAAAVASTYTDKKIDNLDVIFNIKTEAQIIAGQSAGSSMALSTIAALDNITLDTSIIMTGSINEDGTLGDAGGISEKATAAKEGNARLFLVPSGAGSTITSYERVKQCDGTYCTLNYEKTTMPLGDELGIPIKEIATIEEAVRYHL